MELTYVEYSVSGHVAHLVLNNPERLNALGPVMGADLVAALSEAAADPQVRVVLLSGAGKAFCAGGDLATFESGLANGDLDMAGLVRSMGEVAVLIRTMPKPVITSVHRVAVGAGMGLALLSDYCIVADDASFTTGFIKLGLTPDTGVGFVLARTLGSARASDLLMSGRSISAAEAKELGLVTEVVPAAELSQATVDFVGGLVTGPTGALAGIKEQLWGSFYAGFEEHLAREVTQQTERSETPDFVEGLRAFREKRQPDFLTGPVS